MSEVVIEDKGAVRWLTLNRPEVMNAITTDMLSQLNDELKKADDDPKVRILVITGAGKGFCTGLDLKQAAAGEGIGGAGLASAGARHYSTREICTVTMQRMDT
ncbi:MAG: enoyl-CoA hydratase/isomerase family protein, partial [Gammaproteobacteria bacterium]|nr:enoyl-CoA hydratase/isomerase family protein [Gammaproteobacteria bacterium]